MGHCYVTHLVVYLVIFVAKIFLTLGDGQLLVFTEGNSPRFHKLSAQSLAVVKVSVNLFYS